MVDQVFGNAAVEQFAEAGAGVGGHGDHIDVGFFNKAFDLKGRATKTHFTGNGVARLFQHLFGGKQLFAQLVRQRGF